MGTIIEISLPNERYAYARILRDAALGVYHATSDDPGLAPARDEPYRFVVGVHDQAFEAKGWRVIGHLDPLDGDDFPPPFAVRDAITGGVRVYEHGAMRDAYANEDPTALEPAAVWDGHHIVDRIMGR